MKLLFIKPDNEQIKKYYQKYVNYYLYENYISLFTVNDIIIMPGETKIIDFGIQCEMNDLSNFPPSYKPRSNNCSYFLYPNLNKFEYISLISNNDIIDSSYRDNIKITMKYYPNYHILNDNLLKFGIESLPEIKIERGSKIAKIYAPDLSKIQVEIVNQLS